MAYAFAKDIFVVGAKRTAFGTFGGSLKGHTANDLQVTFQIIFGFRNNYVQWTKMSFMNYLSVIIAFQTIANVAALAQAGVAPELADTTVVGNVMQSSTDAAYLARHAALRAGCKDTIPALTVNRLCGSGFEAVAQVATDIALGKEKFKIFSSIMTSQ